MIFRIIHHQGGGFDVEDADTHEIKNVSPYRTRAKAQAFLNSHSADRKPATVKSGSRNNAQDRQVIRNIRGLASQIHDHTMMLEPSDSDEGMDDKEEVDGMEDMDGVDETGSMGDGKAMNLSYVKSLGVLFPSDVFAVKYVGRNEIRHYPFLWGNPQKTDVELDYFTRETDFFDSFYGKSSRPLTWDHAQDKGYKGDLIIGRTVDWGDDAVGRWAQSVITISGKYRKAIDEMIEAGILGSSSDSAGQYVERETRGKSRWIKRWPWVATSLTATPAEPRMIGSIETLKSLGIKLPDAPDVARRERIARLNYELLKMKSK